MKDEQSSSNRSQRAKWRQILDLGEKLLCLGQSSLAETSSAHAVITNQQDLILEVAERLFEGQVELWLAEDELADSAGRPSRSGMGVVPNVLQSSAMMRRAMKSRQVCYSSVGESGQYWAVPDGDEPKNAISVAIPLLARNGEEQGTTVLGVLQVERPAGRPFDEQDIELIRGLGIQITIALQAVRQMAGERWRVEQLILVHQVSAQIADVRDLDELSRRVTKLILQTFGYYYVAIFTLEPGQDILRFRASANSVRVEPSQQNDDVDQEFSPALVVHVGQGIIGHVAQTGQEILANDVKNEARYRHLDVLPETHSEVALPLKIEDQLLGVLDVQSDQLDYFHETDLLVLRALASSIAFAVKGAWLYGALQQRADQLATVYEVSSAIASILEQDRLLEEVVNLIQKRFGHPFVHLFTVHPGRRKIIYEAGDGPYSSELREQGFTIDLDDPDGLVPWVARHGETVLVNDVRSEPRYRSPALPTEEILSELTVPLAFGGQVLGILDVQSDRLNAFDEEDRHLFEALADNIAIALRNATLYRSESWRRRVADSLREVAGLLSADVDLDQVLTTILIELERTLPLDLAAIWLVDEEIEKGESDHAPNLHLAAVYGASTADIDLEVGLMPDEVWEFNASPELVMQYEQASAWLIEALEADHPVIRSPGSLFEPLGAVLGFLPDHSAIAAPLRVGEQSLGVLTLSHRLPGRYGSESSAMTAAFASYAAVAIENTRLYEAAHEQAWVSTVLLQVAEATQSQTDLNELLTTVIRIAPMLAGIKACLLYVLDDDGIFVPAASSGLDTAQEVEFQRWRFTPGDGSAFDKLLIHEGPIILKGESEDLRLASILLAGAGEDQLLKAELLVLVPMLARGEVLGAFLVDYSYDQSGGNSGRALDELFDERLAIIQGIAHQTAIAVENIHLLKSQQEEAYISVALLQVAQAVVSSNDLVEVLGAIVRITPILVGVKRAIIYLWDEGQAGYRMAARYGTPRDADTYLYTPGEFPLLDAVHQEGNLMAHPLSADEAASDDVPEIWSYFTAPDLEEVAELLGSDACLLLAFPLSIKGNVLGTLLIEEPDPLPPEGFGTGSKNRRLRERRLEIITGISQQVALAIQNDQLQREMVERERLEREMQLAREIQRAFLPQHIPDFPAWDLEVRWRTAREVGGDFYDFFPLPDGRLGLVIADVADKGMPAALYMTLVRTLVRATVQEIESPAEVLERINDVLVPDAPQGMFVTLVYAILSLDTGNLEYANAGHNLPLVLRSKTCTLERLETGGMALGVLEGNRIEKHTICVEPGDYLIMYTDGVTEAFSPEGNLYGEGRLYETIGNAALSVAECGSTFIKAQEMLDVIDASVKAFIGDSPLSDDLTLVVLKRVVT